MINDLSGEVGERDSREVGRQRKVGWGCRGKR